MATILESPSNVESQTNFDSDENLIVPLDFVCPLTLEVMNDPVISKHGKNFERSAILNWLGLGHGSCPLTRKPMRLSDIITDHRLRMRIYSWKKKNCCDIHLYHQGTFYDSSCCEGILGFITIEQDRTERTEDDPIIITEQQQRQTSLQQFGSRSIRLQQGLLSRMSLTLGQTSTTNSTRRSEVDHPLSHQTNAQQQSLQGFRNSTSFLRFMRPRRN